MCSNCLSAGKNKGIQFEHKSEIIPTYRQHREIRDGSKGSLFVIDRISLCLKIFNT